MFRKIIILPIIFFVLLAGCVSEKVPEKGTIQFTSSPPGAQIYLDSQFRGTAPSTVTDIEPGTHSIEFRYTGYESWSTDMVVSSGPNNVFAALLPQAGNTSVIGTMATTLAPSSPLTLTLKVEKDIMTIGNTQTFSGTGTPGQNVLLVLYGPGKYTDGVNLYQTNVGADGVWQYTWNPGSSVMSGTYSIVASDVQKTTSVRAGFNVVGGGQLAVTTSRSTYTVGDTITFSGRCTTGAQNVILTLYGPGQFTNGISLGTQSINADNTWTYKYVTSYSTPAGAYIIYVNDAQRTASATSGFSVLTNSGSSTPLS
jgi:hypothetical protein